MRSIQSPREEFFTLVAFDGPDCYSTCGGLADRVSGLAARLAREGFEIHLFFLGEPGLPAIERMRSSRLTLHRWAQWLGGRFPGGVHDGEWVKLREMAESLPPFLSETLVRPAIRAAFLPVILGEEWQTAPCMIALGAELERLGPAGQARLLWPTGSVTGWDQVDWVALAAAAEVGATEHAPVMALNDRGIPAVHLPADPQALLELLGSSPPRNSRVSAYTPSPAAIVSAIP